MTNNYCPVCYYPDLDRLAEAYDICPCCGTMFLDKTKDFNHISYTDLRNRWIDKGCFWWFKKRICSDGSFLGMEDPRTSNIPWDTPENIEINL